VRINSFKNAMSGSIVAMLGLIGAQEAAATIDLNGLGYVQYGDAQSYSLPIGCVQVGQNYTQCDYNIQSSPGQIADDIVVATGTNNGPVNNNPAGMDDAYRTPDGTGQNFVTTVTAATGGASDPDGSGEFTGDLENTWDTTVGALLNFLGGDQMVLFFNNNQLNGEEQQNLAAWAQITVTDYTGVSPTELGVFDFTNNNGHYDLVSQGGGGTFLGDVTSYVSDGSGPDGNTNDNTDYVLSGGPICVDTHSAAIPIPVPCSSPDADEGPINHNLGADHAAYAILFPELNELLDSLAVSGKDLSQVAMSIQFNLGCDPTLFGSDKNAAICTGDPSDPTNPYGKNINNGYEQIFIRAAARPDVPNHLVPLPGTILLFGLGALALARVRRH
jgi:hypothetical protein